MALMTNTSLATKPVYATLPVEDVTRAKQFYHETLGLDIEDQGSDGFLVRGGSGSQLFFYRSQVSHPSGNTVAGWIVDDVRATVSELRGHGVRFEEYNLPGLKTVDGVAETTMGPGAWFKDSEGNIISLIQM